jgi:hypothetical protein
MATDAPAFDYEPLPDPRTHLRLLRILKGSFDRPIVCELSCWAIDRAPPYIAVSYTWGEAGSVSVIAINGKSMTIRKNCEYVLQQQASVRGSAQCYFWVDAICINQRGVQEKNHQVALMGKIYKTATDVYACVGPHADDSQ